MFQKGKVEIQKVSPKGTKAKQKRNPRTFQSNLI
jgi:hypothetical protein